MCQYCGCRAVPLIRDYIAEHDHVLNLLDSALRAIAVDDLGGAARGRLSDAREARGEATGPARRTGIFKVMAARDEEYATYVAPLVEEHRELEQLLARLDVSDPNDQQELRTALTELRERIGREKERVVPGILDRAERRRLECLDERMAASTPWRVHAR